ncbi:MAG: hypothetical protein ABL921_33360, partial [Pirellula sp.]
MNRRHFIASVVALSAARSVLSSVNINRRSKLGMCTFSCHRHWSAVREGSVPTKFRDGPTYYNYARELGGDGVQTGIASLTEEQIASFRKTVERTDGYYEGDIRLPNRESELEAFEQDVVRASAAGATAARAC